MKRTKKTNTAQKTCPNNSLWSQSWGRKGDYGEKDMWKSRF